MQKNTKLVHRDESNLLYVVVALTIKHSGNHEGPKSGLSRKSTRKSHDRTPKISSPNLEVEGYCCFINCMGSVNKRRPMVAMSQTRRKPILSIWKIRYEFKHSISNGYVIYRIKSHTYPIIDNKEGESHYGNKIYLFTRILLNTRIHQDLKFLLQILHSPRGKETILFSV